MQFSTAVFSTLLLAGLGAAQSTTFGTSPSPTVSSASHTTSTGSSSTSVASLVASLPQCALGCFAQAAATAGCSTTDFSCICTQLSKSTSATTQLGLCALGACPNANLTDLTNKAGELCTEVTSGGASASDLAAASSYVASAVNAASSTSTKSGNAAVRTEMPIAMGLMGAIAALAVAL